MESGGNFEDYIRFLSCNLFGPVNHCQNWKGWDTLIQNPRIFRVTIKHTTLKVETRLIGESFGYVMGECDI